MPFNHAPIQAANIQVLIFVHCFLKLANYTQSLQPSSLPIGLLNNIQNLQNHYRFPDPIPFYDMDILDTLDNIS